MTSKPRRPRIRKALLRADEKQASRKADADAQISAENGAFAFPRERVRIVRAVRLVRNRAERFAKAHVCVLKHHAETFEKLAEISEHLANEALRPDEPDDE